MLAFSETLWRWADAVMDVVAASHREVELQLAREEQQRRDAFVLALLTGSSDAAELRRDSAAYGIDPEREYVPFRARAHNGDDTKPSRTGPPSRWPATTGSSPASTATSSGSRRARPWRSPG